MSKRSLTAGIVLAASLLVGVVNAADNEPAPPAVQQLPRALPAWDVVDRDIHLLLRSWERWRSDLMQSTNQVSVEKAMRVGQLLVRLDGIHEQLKASRTRAELEFVLNELTLLQGDADRLRDDLKAVDALTKSSEKPLGSLEAAAKMVGATNTKTTDTKARDLTKQVTAADEELFQALEANLGAPQSARNAVIAVSQKLRQLLKDLQTGTNEAQVSGVLGEAAKALRDLQAASALALAAAAPADRANKDLTLAKDHLQDQIKPRAVTAERTPIASTRSNVTLTNGAHVSYGLSLSLLRFSTSRRIDEPSRRRNYTPSLELIPAEFGFQFLYQPDGSPWRQRRVGGGEFQMISVGGVFLARVDNERFERGGLALGGMLSFFDDSVGIGAGFDLYRGIPVQGPGGESGTATAYTGLLAWGLAKEGEITPENAFVLLSINLAAVAGRVTGTAQ